MKKSVLLFSMLSMAALWISGCSPDKDVTASPEYNFSSFAGTVWKTRTKTAIAETKGYSGGPKFMILPPAYFDQTDTNFVESPDVKSIVVLPPGTRLRITRLLQGQGQSGGYGVEAIVEAGTKGPTASYLDRLFLANVQWVNGGPTSTTNWGVNPEMLEKAGPPPQP